jgi:hypothetical protein
MTCFGEFAMIFLKNSTIFIRFLLKNSALFLKFLQKFLQFHNSLLPPLRFCPGISPRDRGIMLFPRPAELAFGGVSLGFQGGKPAVTQPG